jgi:PAS domain S-box-containing protein
MKSDSKHIERLIDSVPSLIHTARPDGYLDYFNQRWLDYVGLPIEDLLGWKWTAAIHPEDVEATVDKLRSSIESGEPFVHEARVRRADGEYRWMLHHKVAVRNELGTIIKWHGSSIDIEDRKRAEQALKVASHDLQDSKAKIEEAQRFAHVGYWELDLATDCLIWSDETYRIFGLQPQERPMNMGTVRELIHPEDRDYVFRGKEETLRSGARYEVEHRLVRPSGEVRIVNSTRAVKTDASGRPSHMFGTVEDITDRKRAEEALQQLTQELRRREAYLAEAQRLSHTGSFGWKVSSGEIFWSDETFRIFQCDPTTKPTLEFVLSRVHPDDSDLVQQQIERATRDGEGFDFEHRLQLPDRCTKHVRVSALPSRDSSGDLEFVGAVTDVTETREAEGALRRSERYLAEAQTLTHMGSWVWQMAGGDALHLSDEWYRIYGFDPKKGIPAWEERLQRVHPEDRDKWQRTIERGICERSDYEVEFRILLPDGTLKWVYTVAHPVFSATGELVQFVGSSMDVTERKRAEEKSREQEAELRQMLDLTPQYLCVRGPDGSPLYANRASLDYLGMTLDEWRQRGMLGDEVHPDDLERLNRASSSGSAYELELRVRNRDGNFRWALSRFNPLYDRKGQITRWYVASTDIEDRIRAEGRLKEENAALREEIDKASMFEEIVGTSRALKSVLSHISKVAPSDSTVLITGETGTGKELVARAIHRRSARASGPFVSVNCAAIPRDLVASELFGHEKGAFTGATQRRLGRFELADGGTIFLDEVGELLPETQVALLRVLQEREIQRLGGSQPIHVDVRVVAATNRHLEAAVSNGSFRQDLLYRLNVFPIEVPPLRERKDDILMLVEYFLQRYASRAGKNIRSIDKKTADLLRCYDWPGNIRELQNVVERSVILCSSEAFSVDESWLSKRSSRPASRVHTPAPLKVEAEPPSEREIIEAALAASRGRVSGPSGAADRLGIPPSTLDDRIKVLKIDKTRFKYRRGPRQS